MVQFPAVVSLVERAGEKVKRTGMTRHDVAWMTESLVGLRPVPSRVSITGEEFEAVGLDSAFVDSSSVAPGKPIPIENKFEIGRLFTLHPLDEVTDYRILRGKGLVRFAIATWQCYVLVQAIGWKTVRKPSARKALIVSSHRYYEDVGVNHPTGPGLMTEYDDVFVKFCFKLFRALEDDGKVCADPGFLAPYCGQHGRTGEWDRSVGKWLCVRCHQPIPWRMPERRRPPPESEEGDVAKDGGEGEAKP